MKIISFYGNKKEKDYLSKKMIQDDLVFLSDNDPESVNFKDENAEVLSVFVNHKVGGLEMDRFPKLKFIATRSTGYDHIDLAEAERRNIVVSNVPTYGENTVAEFAFALILALSRKIYNAYDRILKQGVFSHEGLEGFDLMGKTIGVVGTGNIGKHTIKMANGFSMNILAYDVNRNEVFAKEAGFKYVGLDELLNSSDIITLHVPYNSHTHHLINRENILKIKNGAYLINTSRGGVVETVALVEALEKGILAGAGLDVLEEEEYMGDETALLMQEHPNPEDLKVLLANQYLIDHPQVIITPHNAFNTSEAIERILKTTVDNIEAYKKGAPINIVKQVK